MAGETGVTFLELPSQLIRAVRSLCSAAVAVRSVSLAPHMEIKPETTGRQSNYCSHLHTSHQTLTASTSGQYHMAVTGRSQYHLMKVVFMAK